MNRGRRAGAIAAAGVALAVVGSVWLVSESPKRTPPNADPADPAAVAARVTATAAARIRAESRGAPDAPAIATAPPARATAPVADSGPAPRPLPSGYSPVTHRGDMATAPLQGSSAVEADDAAAMPDWIAASDPAALVDQAARAGRDWSFGWLWLNGAGTVDGLRADLRRLGGEALGSAGRLVRARLPGDGARLASIAALVGVGGLGAVPAELKLPAAFSPGRAHEHIPVFITLMADDPDGRWRRALEGLGAEVGRYDADIRAYAANVSHGALDALAQADFVLALEPVRVVEAQHDTAVPALGADALRSWLSPGVFSGGGASVPVGIIDSGLNVNHLDIASNRDSICGANFTSASGWSGDLDLWVDRNGHGTHTAGTFLGNGFVDPRLAGVAPSIRDIRFAKALDDTGSGDTVGIVRAMDFLSAPTACASAGRTGGPVRPLIVNASLSMQGQAFAGREVDERKLDAMVWGHRQLYVVAQGNDAGFAFANIASAKNSFSVGAVRDGGALALFSSLGPTGDGRLAPQIVATGVSIRSAAGGGSRGDYQDASGTSSAAPAVAGIAALLMDAAPAYRRQPALTRARLMASAIKPDPWLDAPGRYPADNTEGPGELQLRYGLGRASARTAVLDRAGADGWTNGSATSVLTDGEYAYEDIEVPEGTRRLDLVLTWDEPPAETLSAAVLNDLDLWLDRDGDCGPAACGEYASRSRGDNVEWIVVRDPPPGTYRAKVTPRRVYGAAPRAALAWTAIRGASTPTLKMRADRQPVPAGRSRLVLTIEADAYVAAGTRLRVDCRAAPGSSCSEVSLHDVRPGREDGVAARGADWTLGTHLALGEIGAGEAQEVELLVDYEGKQDGAVRLYFTATAWNANAAVLPLGVGAAVVEPQVVPPRENDAFADAFGIEGAKGAVDLDLASFSTEPGEPAVAPTAERGDWGDSTIADNVAAEPPRGRPAASAWYLWTAPADGHFRFDLGRRPDEAEPLYVDVYSGDDIAGLHRIGSNASRDGDFYAERGASYRVRVSNGTHRTIAYGRSMPATLGWSALERPANDDFEFGEAIEGGEGRFAGSNRGATLEPGEWFGGLASTVWHHWTAPRDGAVRFDSSSGLVMAFTGETASELRLVSQRPDDKAIFPVRGGDEYRIAVAAESAFGAGAAYDLDWRYEERDAGNDAFGAAESLGGETWSHHVGVDGDSTVEPGEPPETGVRSKWWVWTAPETGTYTWRLEDAAYARLRIAAFSGDSVDGLRLAGTTGPGIASSEFTMEAVRDRRYRISAGLPAGDLSAFTEDGLHAALAWGHTPANDAVGGAAPLTGAAGSVTGSNAFATVDPGERIGGLGHSSLWWSYEAPASGWYRFRLEDAGLPFALGVYEVAPDGSLELLGVSRRPASPSTIGQLSSAAPGHGQGPAAPAFSADLVFRADGGGRYLIRLGALSGGPGGEFTLRWGETVAPVWLRYLGYLAGGDADPAGAYIDPDRLAGLSGLAADGDGGRLYAATSGGLVVFERDAASGALTLSQTLSRDWSGVPRSLLHDARRSRLYAHSCAPWEVFSTSGGRVADERSDEAGAGFCGDRRAFMDSAASSVYVVNPGIGLALLGFGEDGRLRDDQPVNFPDRLLDALIANGDTHVHALTNRALVVFERATDTGALTEAGSLPLMSDNFEFAQHGGLAISRDDAYLFAFTDSSVGNEVAIFDLATDPANPQALDRLSLDDHLQGLGGPGCRVAGARSATPGIDLVCHGTVLGVQYNPESGRLTLADSVRRVDRFNNVVPEFRVPRSLAMSPDGRHAYLATGDSRILFFERVGNADCAHETPAPRCFLDEGSDAH